VSQIGARRRRRTRGAVSVEKWSVSELGDCPSVAKLDQGSPPRSHAPRRALRPHIASLLESDPTDGRETRRLVKRFTPTYPIARYAAHGEESVAFVDSYESANYAVTTFRGIQDRKGHLDELHMFGYPVHEVVVQGRVVGILFRRHT
jgi:hypothetical protein